MNICIYTTQDKIKHKIATKENRIGVAYWTLANFPKKLDRYDEDNNQKIYFAWDGFIQGYFDYTYNPLYQGKRISDDAVKFDPFFRELKKKIPIKSFQGFKYIKENYA